MGGLKGDPVIILLDHSYMTPLKLRDNVKRYCKAVAKHSANAKFIDARYGSNRRVKGSAVCGSWL